MTKDVHIHKLKGIVVKMEAFLKHSAKMSQDAINKMFSLSAEELGQIEDELNAISPELTVNSILDNSD